MVGIVVGGHLGVFEGNGGDLRIGLSLQSLHDGERWVHSPLRLAVFIEASRQAIDTILDKHPKVWGLVKNEWMHLFQLDTATRTIFARWQGGWNDSIAAASLHTSSGRESSPILPRQA